MSSDQSIDILMITWRRPEYTRRSLRRLLDTCDDDMRVWVWHNGDHTATLDVVDSFAAHPRLFRVHRSARNERLRTPTNWLLRNAEGSFLSKVDDDCLMPDGWAQTLRAAHADESRFGVLGCWRFQPEDYVPELADDRIGTFSGGHRVLQNCWVEGSGYLMKRACVEHAGDLRSNESFTHYCIRVARGGFVNGWYYPFLEQEHMDDPRAPHTLLRRDADIVAHAPLSARHRGVCTLDEWVAQLRRSALTVQQAPLDPRQYLGVRKKLRRLWTRVRGKELVY